jgi:nitrous oxidase accessory protein
MFRITRPRQLRYGYKGGNPMTMRILKYILFLLLLLFIPTVSEAASTLQSKIDAASNGAVIEIDEGEFEETITVSKSITLVGKGEVLLRSCEPGSVVAITGESVTLKNITIEHCGDQLEDTVLFVSGSKHVLEELNIVTKRFGIRLDHANDVTIQGSNIMGKKRGNGIDLWKSNRNQLNNLIIGNVADGIYLEQSHENMITNNDIQKSRYGMHLMFSNDNAISQNISTSNITGIMLMESLRTSVTSNSFYSNSDNVNSQGLLIYSASETAVTENEFKSNRVGIFIEEADHNLIDSNKIVDNFVGVQFKKATDNHIVGNTFVGNVNDAQAIASSNNNMEGNYWDAASKVDVNGNGTSEIIFTADPYFLTLTANVPEYQLFFQAPGLILLQNMLKSPPEQLLTDVAPAMNMTMVVEKETTSNSVLWMISGVMIVASLSLFILGRKIR